jgi:hypothetical protein
MASAVSGPSHELPLRSAGPQSAHFRGITLRRLEQFEASSLTSALYKGSVDDAAHVKMTVWSPPGREKPTFEQVSSFAILSSPAR